MRINWGQPTIVDNCDKAVEEGLQAMMTSGDDLVENLGEKKKQ